MLKEFVVVCKAVMEGELTSHCMHVWTNCKDSAIREFKHDICELHSLYEDDLMEIRVHKA